MSLMHSRRAAYWTLANPNPCFYLRSTPLYADKGDTVNAFLSSTDHRISSVCAACSSCTPPVILAI
jgi:hypothetical protein